MSTGYSFGIGVWASIFHILGYSPRETQLLSILQRGTQMYSANSLITVDGTSSGAVDFFVFSFKSWSRTFNGVKTTFKSSPTAGMFIYSHQLGCTHCLLQRIYQQSTLLAAGQSSL